MFNIYTYIKAYVETHFKKYIYKYYTLVYFYLTYNISIVGVSNPCHLNSFLYFFIHETLIKLLFLFGVYLEHNSPLSKQLSQMYKIKVYKYVQTKYFSPSLHSNSIYVLLCHNLILNKSNNMLEKSRKSLS